MIPSGQVVSPIPDIIPEPTFMVLPVIPPPARSVRASNGDEPLTQRRTRRTRAQMQADYDQMTPAEKAVRDRVTTRNSERAVARAATRNTARQTEI